MDRQPNRYFPPHHPFRRPSLFHRVITLPLRRLFLCCTPGIEEPYKLQPTSSKLTGHHQHRAETRNPPDVDEKRQTNGPNRCKVAPYSEGSPLSHQPLAGFIQNLPRRPRDENKTTRSSAATLKKHYRNDGLPIPSNPANTSAASRNYGDCSSELHQRITSSEEVKPAKKSSKKQRRGRKSKKNQILPVAAEPVAIATGHRNHIRPERRSSLVVSDLGSKQLELGKKAHHQQVNKTFTTDNQQENPFVVNGNNDTKTDFAPKGRPRIVRQQTPRYHHLNKKLDIFGRGERIPRQPDNIDRRDADKVQGTGAAGNNPQPNPREMKVKPASEQISYSSPPPRSSRRHRQYENPAQFTCRPLPAILKSVANRQPQNTPKELQAKPKLSQQQGAIPQHFVNEPKRYANPGRMTSMPVTYNGVTTQTLKCTLYKFGDFDAVTANGQPIKLGEGSFGEVTLMRLRSSKSPLVAVKRCDAGFVKEEDVWREVKAMQVAQDHWAFPKLYGAIKSHQLTAIVQEFIGNSTSMTGLTVGNAILLKKHMPFKNNWVWIANDIARGLAHLHSQGYLHCDLKTNNVLLWHDGNMWRAKIIDMGKACRKEEAKGPLSFSRAEQRENFKRFPHVPHEVISGSEGYTVEGDIYSFGYLLMQIAEVSSLSKNMKQLGVRCYAHRPSSRPSLAVVIQELTSLGVNGF